MDENKNLSLNMESNETKPDQLVKDRSLQIGTKRKLVMPIRINMEEELKLLQDPNFQYSITEDKSKSKESLESFNSSKSENEKILEDSGDSKILMPPNQNVSENKTFPCTLKPTFCRNATFPFNTEPKSAPLFLKPNAPMKMKEKPSETITTNPALINSNVLLSDLPNKPDKLIENLKTESNTKVEKILYSQPVVNKIKKSQRIKNEKENSASSIQKQNIIETEKIGSKQCALCWNPKTTKVQDTFKKIIVKKTEYVILNKIGKGGSSVVYHCYDLINNKECAIKAVNIGKNECLKNVYINEVDMLRNLQCCDRIIKMYTYEWFEKEKQLMVVMEKGEKDLSQILEELAMKNEHLPIYVLTFYWLEMLQAVKQIHEKGVIHTDLKPANFLLVKGHIKLIDFGISSKIQSDDTSIVRNFALGTFSYISPEAITNQSNGFKISYKTDVWSLGCILYQLVYRKTPFSHIIHSAAKIATIMDPKSKISYPEADWVPASTIQMIKDCLQFDMKSRPSIDELISRCYNKFF